MQNPDDLSRRLARLNRLRKLGVRRGAARDPRPAPSTAAPEPAAEALPGQPSETPFGPAWVRTERFRLAEWPGLAQWPRAAPEVLASLAAIDPGSAGPAMNPARVAFIDTETTGLSLGTGTYTFLIGIGTYEGMAEAGGGESDPAFVVRQYFMRDPGEERAQLHLVDEALARCTGIVSFNGRAFDMPLVHNRFILAGMPLPLVGAPHLDLLPLARRLWRGRWGSCRLGNLETNVLGLVRTSEDVPGYLIPDIYRRYYQTGAATEMLARVFYHNLQDIVSMPMLAEQMLLRFDPRGPGFSLQGLHATECLSLARCYRLLDWPEASIEAYREALGSAAALPERVQALRELSAHYKRLGRRDEAAAAWEEWVSTEPGGDPTPYIELAKHHEWHTGDLAAARGWAAWALRIAGDAPAAVELRHRLARLEGKLSVSSR